MLFDEDFQDNTVVGDGGEDSTQKPPAGDEPETQGEKTEEEQI